MSIQEHLNKIRNAIKGSEVRESIAKGIETAYDDASEYGNANMEVKIARGTHPNLRSRLDETTAQLGQKADKGNVSVFDINKNLGKFDQTYMSEEFLQQITGDTPINAVPADGSLTTPKYAHKSVTPNKLSDYNQPKNLLAINGLGFSPGIINNTGNVEASTEYKTSDYIELDKSYSHITFSSMGNGAIVFFNGGSFVEYKLVSSNYEVDGNFVMTHPIPASATHMRVSVNPHPAVWSQVEYGQVATSYSTEGRYTLKGLKVGVDEEYVDGRFEELIESRLSSEEGIKPFNHDAEIVMFTAYGQSWALGYDETAYSTEQIYDNLMFNIGISNQPLEDEQIPTSLVPLIEENGTHYWSELGESQPIGETPVAGQTNMVKQLLLEENNTTTSNADYQLLGNAPGVGSASIDNLSKGTKWYNRLITQVQQAYDLAQSQGKTFNMLAFSWTQGSGGEKLETLRSDIEADVKAITGQSEPVVCITWQNFPTTSTQARSRYDNFVKISDTYEHIYTAGPSYQLKTLSKENLHFEKISTIELGALYGRVFKRVINDKLDWQPLRPVKITTQGKIALIEFNASTPLIFDTTKITLADNFGFKVKNDSGTDQILNSVEIVSPNTVKIVKSTNFADTDRVIYGTTGTGWGGTDGNRGNLRDSSNDVYKYKDLKIPLHNWCIVFDLSVAELNTVDGNSAVDESK